MLLNYRATRPVLASGDGSVGLFANQRGDVAIQEQYVPDAEDNANDVIWGAQRATATATGAWTRSGSGGTSVGLTIPAVVKASPGRVRQIRVSNKNATTGFWAMVKNKASAMVAADTPDDRVWVPPASATAPGGAVIDYGSEGAYFSTGIALGFSTGADTLAALAANDAHYTIYWS